MRKLRTTVMGGRGLGSGNSAFTLAMLLMYCTVCCDGSKTASSPSRFTASFPLLTCQTT